MKKDNILKRQHKQISSLTNKSKQAKKKRKHETNMNVDSRSELLNNDEVTPSTTLDEESTTQPSTNHNNNINNNTLFNEESKTTTEETDDHSPPVVIRNSENKSESKLNLKNVIPPKPKTNYRIDLGKEWKSMKNPAIHPELLSVIENDFKFTHMSPVQENTIPLLLNNKDVVVQALTGSGKTLAFIIPIFQYVLTRQFEGKIPSTEEILSRRKNVYSIVLLPTRELARQVYDVACKFAPNTNLNVKLFIGGEERETLQPASGFGSTEKSSINPNESMFLDCNIAIGTPGRILDYLNSKLLKVRCLEILIIDEADIILNMGFRQQVDQILSHLPKQRRTGLFSATQTSELDDLVRSGLRNPMKVAASEHAENKKATVPSQLSNFYMYCDYRQKLNYLLHLIKNDDPIPSGNSIIVYFLTCAAVDYFSKLLKEILGKNEETIQLFSLHGQMVQKRRNAEHQSFKEACENITKQQQSENQSVISKKAVLFCTDVAARGLDFPNIATIVQFDAPTNPDQFVHRVGRTARMGKQGQSLLFLSKAEHDYIDYLTFKKISMYELEASDEMKNNNYVSKENIKKIIRTDRDIFEKGEEALKSFVRSYKEHQCSYIFKFAKLRFDQLLEAYCILTKPTIREIKQQMETIILPFEDIDIDTIPYKDVRREKARKERLKKQEENEQVLEEKRLQKIAEKKEEKKNSVNYLKDKVRNRSDISTNEKKRLYNQLENQEFNDEALLLKRLKRGKISEEDFERLSGESKLEGEIMKQLSERKRKQLQQKKRK